MNEKKPLLRIESQYFVLRNSFVCWSPNLSIECCPDEWVITYGVKNILTHIVKNYQLGFFKYVINFGVHYFILWLAIVTNVRSSGQKVFFFCFRRLTKTDLNFFWDGLWSIQIAISDGFQFVVICFLCEIYIFFLFWFVFIYYFFNVSSILHYVKMKSRLF